MCVSVTDLLPTTLRTNERSSSAGKDQSFMILAFLADELHFFSLQQRPHKQHVFTLDCTGSGTCAFQAGGKNSP